ncbi:MAG: hypothetical protein ABSE64_05760 [Vulcanimicrobiaceae bacterium]|jgi:hypothetical protein
MKVVLLIAACFFIVFLFRDAIAQRFPRVSIYAFTFVLLVWILVAWTFVEVFRAMLRTTTLASRLLLLLRFAPALFLGISTIERGPWLTISGIAYIVMFANFMRLPRRPRESLP